MTRLADALERARGAVTAPAVSPDVEAVARPVAVPRAPAFADAIAPPPPLNQPMLATEAALVRAPMGAQERASKMRASARSSGKVVGTVGMPRACVEQYRKLAATLHHLQLDRGVKTLMVSSAMPGEGKTLTAVNVSVTLSESYRKRVLLIDADLRRPTLHQVFDLPNLTGLGDGLRGETDNPLPLVQMSSHLTVLTAGRPDQDPTSALTSARMRRVVTEAAAAYDWVIIDTPPVGLLADARLLTDLVQGTLFVIRAGATPFALVQRAVEALGRDRITGVVLNALNPNQHGAAIGYGYGYGYYYAPTSDDGHRRNRRDPS